MRKSNWTLPDENDRPIYSVADDLGKPGRAWREADYDATPFYLQDFTDRYEGRYHDIQLPLRMRLV